MALFQLRWLRRLIRQHTNPIPANKAAFWKKKLSFAYMFVAWNAFGLVVYMVYTGKADWAKYHGLKSDVELNMSPAQQWCQTFGIDKAKVYRFSGFRKEQEYIVEDGNITKDRESGN